MARGEEKLRVAPTPHHTKSVFWNLFSGKLLPDKWKRQQEHNFIKPSSGQWWTSLCWTWPGSGKRLDSLWTQGLEDVSRPPVLTAGGSSPSRIDQNSNKLQETSRVCSAGSSRVPPGSDWESLSSWAKSHGRSLVSHNLRSQVLRSRRCGNVDLFYWIDFQLHKCLILSHIVISILIPAANKVVAQTFAPRLDFFELSDVDCIKDCSVDGLKRYPRIEFNGFRIVEFLFPKPNSPNDKHFLWCTRRILLDDVGALILFCSNASIDQILLTWGHPEYKEICYSIEIYISIGLYQQGLLGILMYWKANAK